jgi:N-ethylmaleimide reductase
MADLFSSYSLGNLTLANRLVMAPMTRNRASEQGVPGELMATYYGQRASAGLLISESAPVAQQAVGYPFTPGLFTDEQVEGWRHVTASVHRAGSLIFAQLQHCGRISHPSHQLDGSLPVAPSAIRPQGMAVTASGMQPFATPRALAVAEIADVVQQFKDAASRARAAGFDGVEVHGANGYLIDQFLRDCTNHRADAYGGSPARRLALLMEVIEAVAEIWPRERIGVRLSPENRFNDMSDSNAQEHFGFFVDELSRQGIAYLHVLEGDMANRASSFDYRELRRCFGGTYIANNGYDKRRAQAALLEGSADLIAFGAPFLANPDLVERLRRDLPLNVPDHATFYGGGQRGYVDYPVFDEATAGVNP